MIYSTKFVSYFSKFKSNMYKILNSRRIWIYSEILNGLKATGPKLPAAQLAQDMVAYLHKIATAHGHTGPHCLAAQQHRLARALAGASCARPCGSTMASAHINGTRPQPQGPDGDHSSVWQQGDGVSPMRELDGREQRWCGGGVGEAAIGARALAQTRLWWVAHRGTGQIREKRAMTMTWLGCGGSLAPAGDWTAVRVLDLAGGNPGAARRWLLQGFTRWRGRTCAEEQRSVRQRLAGQRARY
jgi:hypothetical protein